MGVDNFGTHYSTLSDPASDAVAVTPSDTEDLAVYARSLFIGGDGDINVDMVDGTTVLFTAVKAGSVIPIRVKRVRATSTTATAIVGLI
jgi:hypothetical protein